MKLKSEINKEENQYLFFHIPFFSISRFFHYSHSKIHNGFSVIELLIVLSIISILAGLSAPQLMYVLRARQTTGCAMQRVETQNAERQYVVDHGIPSTSINDLIQAKYLSAYPQCPAGGTYLWINDANQTNPFRNLGCSIHYFPSTGVSAVIAGIPGATAVWSMDEGKGGILYDPLGNNNGIIYGAEWVAGKVGSALKFSGVNANGLNDYAKIPNNAALNLTDKGTLQSWINPDSIMSYGGIIHKGDNKNLSDEAYSLQLYDSKLALALVDDKGVKWLLKSQVEPRTDAWTNVASTWGADGMKMYVNGEIVKATLYQSKDGDNWIKAANQNQSVTARTTGGDVQIGAQLDQRYNKDLKNMGFNGIIDEVNISDNTLTAAQIKAYYDSTK